MKIRVERRDGSIEVLTLRKPTLAVTVLGGDSPLDYITDGGTDHYFTKDGHYDGWGAAMAGGTMDEAKEVIEYMEGKREIDSAADGEGNQ